MVDVGAARGVALDLPLAVEPVEDASGLLGRGQAGIDRLEVQDREAVVVGFVIAVDPTDEAARRRAPEAALKLRADGVGERRQLVGRKRAAVGGDAPGRMGGDGTLEVGHPQQGGVQIDRGIGVVAAEREEIPVVVADAEAETRLCASFGQQLEPAAAIMADPAHPHVFLLADRELVQREMKCLPHAADGLAEEGKVGRPVEEIAAGPDEERTGDGMPRVDRRDQRLEVDFGAGGVVDHDPIAGEDPGVCRLAVEWHVGVAHAVFGREPGKLDPPLGHPRSLAFQEPRHGRTRLRRQTAGGPFDPREGSDDRAAAEGGRGDRDDVARGLEHEAADGIDPRHRRPVDLPAVGGGEGLEVERLYREHFVVLRKMEARAAGLLPGGKRPAVTVAEAAMLLHRHVAFGIDRAGEQRGGIPLTRPRPGPQGRMRQHAVPERAVAESLRRVHGMQVLERLHRLLGARHDEPRQVVGGGRDARGQHQAGGEAHRLPLGEHGASHGGNAGA